MADAVAQGTPPRSSPSMRSLASSPMHWLGRRVSTTASPRSQPNRARALGSRRSIDPQPCAPPPHAPLRRAVTEASQKLSLAAAEAEQWPEPPLPDWQQTWQQLQRDNIQPEIGFRVGNRPAPAELPASPFGGSREQEDERTVAASTAAAGGGGRPPRPSSSVASPPPSLPATPRALISARGSGAFSSPIDIHRPAAVFAPHSASPPRPPMQPRHSTGAVRLGAASHHEDVPRRHSMAYENRPAALPTLSVRTSVVLGHAPPQSLPSTPAASRRPPLLRQVSPRSVNNRGCMPCTVSSKIT